MSNYTKKFRVEPGCPVKLKDFDPSEHGKHESHHKARSEIKQNKEKMDTLQELLYADNGHSLLIILQGLDAGGKDGVVKHVIRGMNPQGCVVTGFKQPTSQELSHDFLWRVHPHAPAKGRVAIFNRSQYEDVLVARVHKLASQKIWRERYGLINDWEELITKQNNTTILKFFLHISKKEQLARFEKRLDDPSKQWKISEADYKEREFWDDYTNAYEEMFKETSRRSAPWFIIPSNHKWFRNLSISQIIVESLERMILKRPEPSVDLKEIRKKYHIDLRREHRSKQGKPYHWSNDQESSSHENRNSQR
jgi:PPK2 family polyphosphate:nucleotide phosphotransferase